MYLWHVYTVRKTNIRQVANAGCKQLRKEQAPHRSSALASTSEVVSISELAFPFLSIPYIL